MDGAAGRQAVVLHTTSGTTGTHLSHSSSVPGIAKCRTHSWRVHICCKGSRDDDVIHSVYGFGMVNGGHYVREAVLHFTGAKLLPAGTGSGDSIRTAGSADA